MKQFLKKAGTPLLFLGMLIILIMFPTAKYITPKRSTSTSTNVEQTTKIEPTFTTKVTPIRNNMLMITVKPKSNIRTVNQTHDTLADAFNRLNIQASDIVYILPATKTEPPLIIVRYNSMLHSRAKEYEIKK